MEGKANCICNQEFYGIDLFGKINMKVNYSLPVKKISADLDTN